MPANRDERSRRPLTVYAGPLVAIWATVIVTVVLQWHVLPSAGDGDCGTVWTVVTGHGGLRGCDGPGWAALIAGVCLASALFLGPLAVVFLVRLLVSRGGRVRGR